MIERRLWPCQFGCLLSFSAEPPTCSVETVPLHLREASEFVATQEPGRVQQSEGEMATVSSIALAVAFRRDHQQSETVWPQSGQVCCRSPSFQSLKTAVHFGQKTGSALLGTAGTTGSTA
jgi:hypothetical protein